MIPIESFYLKLLGQQAVNTEDMITVSSKKAVLTLSSSFIELPKEELSQFLK
jgi:hypothetical protein